jgi:CBS domain-containing protein
MDQSKAVPLAERRVAELMTRTVITLRPDQSVQDAVDLFARREFRHIPVANGASLVGVLSDRDVLRALVRSHDIINVPVSTIMRSNPFTTEPDASLCEAAYLLLSHRINSLPVIDGARNLVGILTTTDLLRALLAAAGGG